MRILGFALCAATLGVLIGCEEAGRALGPDMQASTPQQMASDPRVQLAAGCQGYTSGLSVATAAVNSGKLGSDGILRVKAVRDSIGPVCENQAAQNPTTALLAVNQAVVELTATVGSN